MNDPDFNAPPIPVIEQWFEVARAEGLDQDSSKMRNATQSLNGLT